MRRRPSDLIAGIDLSLTGAAVVIIDRRLLSERVRSAEFRWDFIIESARFGYSLPRSATPRELAERLDRVSLEVEKFIGQSACAFIEDYSYGLPQGAHQLGEIGGCVRRDAFRKKIPLTPVGHAAARKTLIGVGSGKGIKEAVHAALRGAGATEQVLRSGDELDAFVIANHGVSITPSEGDRPFFCLTLARPPARR